MRKFQTKSSNFIYPKLYNYPKCNYVIGLPKSQQKSVLNEHINGFSKSILPFIPSNNSPLLIIYLKNILTIKLAFSDFHKLDAILQLTEYKYPGHEPYKWKSFDRRQYKCEQ